MQIIAGKARSLELSAPPGIGVRPTAGRSRKALFDSIGGALAGSCVLDLFSGSGALALEAASRGAAVLWMVESNSRHAAVIEENIRKIRRAGVDASIELLRMSALDTGGMGPSDCAETRVHLCRSALRGVSGVFPAASI